MEKGKKWAARAVLVGAMGVGLAGGVGGGRAWGMEPAGAGTRTVPTAGEMEQLKADVAAALTPWDNDIGSFGLIDKRFPARREEWKKWAEAGVPEAMWLWGVAEMGGLDGGYPNVAEGIRLFKASSDAGFTTASISLANVCIRGVTIPGQEVAPDREMGVKILKAAGDKNDPRALMLLARLLEAKVLARSDEENGRKWLERATAAGSGLAEELLAEWCERGQFGNKDLQAAALHYKHAGESGNARGMHALGLAYYGGRLEPYLPRDEQASREMHRKAAEAGLPRGMYSYAVALFYGYGGAADEAGAIKWWTIAADRGNAAAWTSLGNRYLDGRGVQQNRARAIDCFDKAAQRGDPAGVMSLISQLQQGVGGKPMLEVAAKMARKYGTPEFPDAMAELGCMMIEGKGLPQEKQQGEKLLKDAVALKCASAMFSLGIYRLEGKALTQNTEEAIALLREAAALDYRPAMLALSREMVDGKHMTRDLEGAYRLAEMAAKSPNSEAWRWMGYLHLRSIAPGSSPTEAVRWLTMAEKAGDAPAARYLADAYFVGKDLAVDKEAALTHYRRALQLGDEGIRIWLADAIIKKGGPFAVEPSEGVAMLTPLIAVGNAEALNLMGVAYKQGRGVVKDDEIAATYYKQAADKGEPSGMANYGWMLEHGEGVKKDTLEAMKWYMKAVEAKNGNAALQLARVYSKGIEGVPADAAECERYFQLAVKLGDPQAIKTAELRKIKAKGNG